MAAIQENLDGANLFILHTLRQRALGQSLPLYLVGGPVRDAILGAQVKDLDFVLHGDAVVLARSLSEEMAWGLVVHPRFGTATLTFQDAAIDIVTARRETYQTPGALPQVTPGSIADDLSRRDFSINALALPLFDSNPRVLDQHHGLQDLEDGQVRVLHPASFTDDPTRILRAIRYEQRLGFRLQAQTEDLFRSALDNRAFDAVSGDRIRHELDKILQEVSPAPVLQRASELGVFQSIHPAWSKRLDFSQVGPLLEKAFPADDPLRPLAYLAALAFPLPPDSAAQVLRRLNLPGRHAAVFRDAQTLRERGPALSLPSLSKSQLFQQLEGLHETALKAVAAISPDPLIAQRLTEYLQELRFVRPALGGQAVVAMGVPPGPTVGHLIKKLRNARLDCKVQSEEEERQIVRRVLANRGGG